MIKALKYMGIATLYILLAVFDAIAHQKTKISDWVHRWLFHISEPHPDKKKQW